MGFLWEADSAKAANHKRATPSFAVEHSMGHFVDSLSRAVEALGQVAPVKSLLKWRRSCNKVAYCLPDIPLSLGKRAKQIVDTITKSRSNGVRECTTRVAIG